jgi:tRNA uridine 5-carboxymethylaminomethyl modification enzyme
MLREDNADLRLTETGRTLGLVNDERWNAFARKRDLIRQEQERLDHLWVRPNMLPDEDAIRVLGKPIEREYSLTTLLRRPYISYRSLMTLPNVGNGVADELVAEQIDIQAKYQGYIERQKDEVARRGQHEEMKVPADLDFRSVRGMSKEAQQKLELQRPETVGQAARISGITPAEISLLLVHLKKGVQPQKKRA